MTNNNETSVPTYAHGEIADKTYEVTEMRVNGVQWSLGMAYSDYPILKLEFYTGFAGCPPRYYITTARGVQYSVVY